MFFFFIVIYGYKADDQQPHSQIWKLDGFPWNPAPNLFRFPPLGFVSLALDFFFILIDLVAAVNLLCIFW